MIIFTKGRRVQTLLFSSIGGKPPIVVFEGDIVIDPEVTTEVGDEVTTELGAMPITCEVLPDTEVDIEGEIEVLLPCEE